MSEIDYAFQKSPGMISGMNIPVRHLGRLTEDSIARMRKHPSQLFMGGLTCFDCGATNVVGTFNHLDYPVSTKHTVAQPGAKGTVDQKLLVRAEPNERDLRNHTSPIDTFRAP